MSLFSPQVCSLCHFPLVTAGTWILFMVQSPAFSHLLLFAEPSIRDMWLATDLLDVSCMLQMLASPPCPVVAFLLLTCWALFAVGMKVWVFWSFLSWWLTILVCQNLISHAHYNYGNIWELRMDLILMLFKFFLILALCCMKTNEP